MDSKFNCFWNFMHVMQGGFVFGILDAIDCVTSLPHAIVSMINGDQTEAGVYFADGIIAAVAAALLLHGLKSRRWRFLKAYVIWQSIRITIYAIIMVLSVWLAASRRDLQYFLFVIDFGPYVGILIWGVVIADKAHEYLKEIESRSPSGTINAQQIPVVPPPAPLQLEGAPPAYVDVVGKA